MPENGPDPEVIRENIERARKRRDAAVAELEAATRELDWWRAGRDLFDPGAPGMSAEEAADVAIKELLPQGFQTPSPTLRQTIVMAMRADPHGDWPAERLRDMLVTHGMAERGAKDLTKRITDMAALMVQDELLVRSGRGVYRLADDLAGALSRWLHPITDYGKRAVSDLPAPDPVTREGRHERSRDS